MKRCTKCCEEKPLEAFPKAKRGKYGVASVCKSCRSVYYFANRERDRAQHARWREANLERKRQMDREYHASNPLRARRRAAEWNAAHPERTRERIRQWQARNPDKLRAWGRTRRARELGAPGAGITAAEWRQIKSDCLGMCTYCYRRTKLTLDHVEPLALGGAHCPENAVAACLKCNNSKNDSPLLVWLARRAA